MVRLAARLHDPDLVEHNGRAIRRCVLPTSIARRFEWWLPFFARPGFAVMVEQDAPKFRDDPPDKEPWRDALTKAKSFIQWCDDCQARGVQE